MADTPKAFKYKTISALASSFGCDKATFWANFTEQHFVDMIQLGWKPYKYQMPPSVVDYIEEVVVKRKNRKLLFPNLRDLQ